MTQVEIRPNNPAIASYYGRLKELKQGQGVSGEGQTRKAFGDLLEHTAKAKKWILIEELGRKSTRSSRSIYPDGTLRDQWRLPHGYWEAKDTQDDLDIEIRKKRDRGYPFDNIIFEDTERAVLFQKGEQILDIPLDDSDKLAQLLTRFYNNEIEPFEKFNEAVTFFTSVIPEIATGLQERIAEAHKKNKKFKAEFADFLELCRTALNPNLSAAAIDEMLIQHLLTERLIRKIFQADFRDKNVIAAKVEDVVKALTSKLFNRSDFQAKLEPFYVAIEEAANKLASHQERQHFINTVYEQFFQGYSVKVADTHGIVYTPQEIVDFMCAAVEEVLLDEFGKKLGQDGVTVLDPCTGTGNFIINLINRVNPKYRRGFYKNHLFANEVMLMPYYIAALNIEHAYYELEGHYQSFEGLCFVDTLDLAKKKQMAFSFMTEENTARVQRQQDADITVIIGNPPYNMGQVNENDNNKNRAYEVIDGRIKETYAKDSKATLTRAVYDAYVKFFRWAIDRLGDKDGIVCYVTNNSFVDGLAFDGMRKHLMEDFHRVYHLDLHGNVRQNPKLSGTTHNVFGIQVGVGITVAVRSSKHTDHKLFYHRVPEFWRKEEKLAFLTWNVKEDGTSNALNTVDLEELAPNKKHTWLVSEFETEFQSYISIGNKEAKRNSVRGKGEQAVIFGTYSGGVLTGRDAIVYDFDRSSLEGRIQQFVKNYNSEVDRYKRVDDTNVNDFVDYEKVNWSRNLKRYLTQYRYLDYDQKKIRRSIYRPFTSRMLYFERGSIDEIGQFSKIFPTNQTEQENRVIICSDVAYRANQTSVFISNLIPELHFCASSDSHQCFPFYVYDEDGSNRRENITDWALAQFQAQYSDETITKWDIFYYVYGLLHHPEYRTRYADNLKRELPRIPFAGEFWAFSEAGKQLADIHLNYEDYKRSDAIEWLETGVAATHFRVEKMRPQKKRDSETENYKVFDTLIYNETLTLTGIPEKAFAYRLGNRSALDWVIDQYRIKTDKRSGIKSDPNGYSDDDQYIVQLVERVVQVSVDTVDIVNKLATLAFREE